MADWKFLNILQCSVGFKGTILDGIADKYLVFPTEKDCLDMCVEAYETMKSHYQTMYSGDKETLEKVNKLLGDKPVLHHISSSQTGVYYTPSKYDPDQNSVMLFGKIIWAFKNLQKLEDEILEKKALEKMKKDLEQQKMRLKEEMHVACSKCPTCNK